ncbi:MAG: DUF1631 family protein [Gammaproteobacteria bacterium]
MYAPKRIIRAARDRALTSFSTLSEQTVVEADSFASSAMMDATGNALRDLQTVRSFLRGEARTLRTRMDRHFAGLLERAMETMHVDARKSASADIDYNSLTLIDDDVITRQIEVERMVARLRDAEPVALGRVNLTIAMMHNDHDVRERENPFRPYLLARALYEGLRELMWDESQSKLLFDALGTAMARRLPGFYASILDVFENAGIHARLTARPSAMSRAEQERLAWEHAAERLLNGAHGKAAPGQTPVQQRLVHKLERLKEIGQTGVEGAVASRAPELVDVLWNVFHKPKGAAAESPRETPDTRPALDSALLALQREAAAGTPAIAPLELRDALGDLPTEPQQRRTLDVAALLFDAMVHDELLGAPMQAHVKRLYLPFVRAALGHPELLSDDGHPVRALLDRLGSLAVGIPAGSPLFNAIDREVPKIVGAVLDLFEDDVHVFADARAALDAHVATVLTATDTRVARCAEAVAEAAVASARLAGVGSALSSALQPLQVDPRLADFILGTWARVLSHPGEGTRAAVALLPELLWSAQEKTTVDDRNAMMRMLPELVRKVREGMAAIALPEAPSKAAFDRLVAVHMDVLGNKQAPARRPMTLEQFREHFRNFSLSVQARAVDDDGWLGRFELEAALGRRGVEVTLNGKAAARLAQAGDAALLAWAQPGMAFEIQVEDQYRQALLCAAEPGKRAFVFRMAAPGGQGQPQPLVVYLRDPLLEAMEQQTLRPHEHAPLFDRAVESLMAGAETLSN